MHIKRFFFSLLGMVLALPAAAQYNSGNFVANEASIYWGVRMGVNSTWLAGDMGSRAMAGMTLYAKLEGCLYLPAFAYGIALTGFVGQNYGAGHTERIREAVRISIRLCWVIVFPLSLAITALAPVLLRLFSREPGILQNAREAVQFNLPFYVVYAMNQVWLGAIKGLGKTAYPMLCTLLCYALFRVIWCALLIPVLRSMIAVYLSYDVSFFLMLALLLPMYRRSLRPLA